MPENKDWITPKAEIRNASIADKGLFAIHPIKAGEEVVRWRENYVNSENAQKAKLLGKIVMQFDDDLFSIENPGENDTYFINHSCSPNLWMRNSFTLEAKRDIKCGEELTADYAMWEADESHTPEWECKCGSPNCRHKITGKDWKITELQEKYKDHFIPLINRRIKNQNKTPYQ